jgi:glutathione peroxidase
MFNRRRQALQAIAATSVLAAMPSLASASTACAPWLAQTFPRLQDEAPQALCQFAGRVLLVVNTASQCGYTPQYEGLERLYGRFRAQGFEVLAFPSNDFKQEPGTAQQIAEVCFNTYGVSFPIFSKTTVRGPQANALYRELARRTGQAPGWNFHKYLIDRQANTVLSFPSSVVPEDPRLVREIERMLAART